MDIFNYHAYDIDGYLAQGEAPRIWEQAMWMGIILAELFEGKKSSDLYEIHGYSRDNWRDMADLYFDEFDAMLALVYPQIDSSRPKSQIKEYQNSFVGYGTYVTFERVVY